MKNDHLNYIGIDQRGSLDIPTLSLCHGVSGMQTLVFFLVWNESQNNAINSVSHISYCIHTSSRKKHLPSWIGLASFTFPRRKLCSVVTATRPLVLKRLLWACAYHKKLSHHLPLLIHFNSCCSCKAGYDTLLNKTILNLA